VTWTTGELENVSTTQRDKSSPARPSIEANGWDEFSRTSGTSTDAHQRRVA